MITLPVGFDVNVLLNDFFRLAVPAALVLSVVASGWAIIKIFKKAAK